MGLGALAVPSPRRSPTDSPALRPGPSESFLLFFSLSETASIIRLPSCYIYATALKSSLSIDFFLFFSFLSFLKQSRLFAYRVSKETRVAKSLY